MFELTKLLVANFHVPQMITKCNCQKRSCGGSTVCLILPSSHEEHLIEGPANSEVV